MTAETAWKGSAVSIYDLTTDQGEFDEDPDSNLIAFLIEPEHSGARYRVRKNTPCIAAYHAYLWDAVCGGWRIYLSEKRLIFANRVHGSAIQDGTNTVLQNMSAGGSSIIAVSTRSNQNAIPLYKTRERRTANPVLCILDVVANDDVRKKPLKTQSTFQQVVIDARATENNQVGITNRIHNV